MDDKVVLLTGASSGIGAGAAVHFAKIGYKKLALVARREEQLKKVAAECKEHGARDVIVIPTDLASTEQSANAVKKAVEHFKSIYGVYVVHVIETNNSYART